MPDEITAIQTIPSLHRARLEAITYPPLMTRADAERATDDLAFVQSLRRAVDGARSEMLDPIRARLDALRGQYDAALEKIRTVEQRVKDAILAWRQQERVDRARAAAQAAVAEGVLAGQEAIRDAEAAGLPAETAAEIGVTVARQVQAETAASIDPAPLPPALAGAAGRASVRVDWTFTVTDPSAVPREYLMVDEAKLGRVVRAAKGQLTIPGVTIAARETIVGSRR